MSRKIVITGPESTGKTELAMELATSFKGKYISEYARDYISRLVRPYTYCDVLNIAIEQSRQEEEISKIQEAFVFFDTWLIITKVWFREVYGRYPAWIDERIASANIDLYLLCAPDIPWVPDKVRENGGEKRVYLFGEYEKEILQTGTPYRIVQGSGEKRYKLAESFINEYFNIV